jgi:hypothetical protein
VSSGVNAWRAALALYVFTESKPGNVPLGMARQWKFIACHECVMVLHHLMASMKVIQGSKIRACPSLIPNIDAAALRDSRRRLREAFPDVDDLRNTIAHSGVNGLRPEIHAPDGRFGLTGFHSPQRFGAPFNGELKHLDITSQSMETLEAAARQFLGAFVPAARMLEALGHAD